MDELAAWVACPEGQDVPLQGEGRDVTLRAVRSRHSELCFGAVVSCQGRPVLGWTVRVAVLDAGRAGRCHCG